LSQQVDGVRQPVAYASRALTEQESKAYSIYELECLAVLFGTDKFRKFLEHREFLLETDNQAFSWLLSHSRQLGKIGRWVVKISSLKFKVQHVRGTQNIVADSLSPMFEGHDVSEVSCPVSSILTSFPIAFQELGELQRQDVELKAIIERLERSESVPKYSLSKRIFCFSGRARSERKIVLPMATVDMVFQYFHSSPLGRHLGLFKTLSKIRQNFTWKCRYQDIRRRVSLCRECGLSKPAQNIQWGFLASQVATRPMEKLFVDYVGRFPRSKAGIIMLLVCVCG
jgi:hypothetical protein